MADITFEEIVQAVQKLTPEQKRLLKQTLDDPATDLEFTRESLFAELAVLRSARLLPTGESLRNFYAPVVLDTLTDEELSTN